jgi:hypothetical protein
VEEGRLRRKREQFRDMTAIGAQKLKLRIDDVNAVSALLLQPPRARACFVFAHGAGAGMTHQFMEQFATGLCNRDIATLRYQFPYTGRRLR